MTISYLLDKGKCDIFNFLVAKPADFVPFRQAYMYKHKNAHISAHIQIDYYCGVVVLFPIMDGQQKK